MARYAPSICLLFLLAILATTANATDQNGGPHGDNHGHGHGNGNGRGHGHGSRPSHHPQPSHTTTSCAPSATATSCFTCPTADNGSFALGDHSDSNGVLFCSYPVDAGENPNDFYCKYNDATGTLSQDNDAGFCPVAAVGGGCNVEKREPAVEALKRRVNERATQPQVSRPRFMKSRNDKRSD